MEDKTVSIKDVRDEKLSICGEAQLLNENGEVVAKLYKLC